MNKFLRIASQFLLFGAGFAAGYFIRKRSEVSFEVVSEEELNKYAAQDAQNASESHSDFSAEEEINKVFSGSEGASEAKEGHSKEAGEGIGEGQKIAYFRQWKAEDAKEKYTRSSEEPEDAVITVEEDLDPDFLQGIEEDIRNGIDRPEIEPGTMEDWNHWSGIKDGQYSPIEILWYEEDNIICDDKDQEMDRPEKFIGFDIRKQFEQIPENTTGDPDVRILINHRYDAIYHVTRIFGSWAKKKKMEEFGGELEDDEEDDIYDRFRGLRN